MKPGRCQVKWHAFYKKYSQKKITYYTWVIKGRSDRLHVNNVLEYRAPMIHMLNINYITVIKRKILLTSFVWKTTMPSLKGLVVNLEISANPMVYNGCNDLALRMNNSLPLNIKTFGASCKQTS